MAEHDVTSPIRGTTIQYGIVHKPQAGQMRIQFNEPFPVIPVVVISPYLQRANAQVRAVETINDIERDEFTISSPFGDANYFISWIAIGHPDLHGDDDGH
jgi:hypothetical protein